MPIRGAIDPFLGGMVELKKIMLQVVFFPSKNLKNYATTSKWEKI